MRTGATDAAIRCLQDAYSRNPSPSEMMELGVAYLWLEDYRAASCHFITALKEQAVIGDLFYAMAGTSFWCLGEQRKAVSSWVDGLSSGYTDAAGGVTLPLLLFYASIVEKRVFAESEARRLLLARVAKPLVANWPGALAEFVLGKINLEETERRYYRLSDSDELMCRWQTFFYVGIIELARGNAAGFTELMRATASTSRNDFDSKKSQFLRKLWHAEFFLARYEAKNGRRKARKR